MCGWYKSRQHAGFLNSCCTCTWYQWRRRCDSNSWCVSFFFCLWSLLSFFHPHLEGSFILLWESSDLSPSLVLHTFTAVHHCLFSARALFITDRYVISCLFWVSGFTVLSAGAAGRVVLTFSSSLSLSLCRCVWWESPETTSFLTRPRPSSGGLITSRAARLPLGSQVKGQTSDVMGKVAMRTETMTGPPGAAGEPGSSPETGLKRFGTARLSRGTLLTASSCGLLTSCWEWPRMTAATGTEEVNRHQPQNTRDKQTNHTSLPGYELLLKWWTGPD